MNPRTIRQFGRTQKDARTILSPVRLPVPPPRRIRLNAVSTACGCHSRTSDPRRVLDVQCVNPNRCHNGCMAFALNRDQRNEIAKAVDAIERQLKAMAPTPDCQSLYVIGTNLTIIRANVTTSPPAGSN